MIFTGGHAHGLVRLKGWVVSILLVCLWTDCKDTFPIHSAEILRKKGLETVMKGEHTAGRREIFKEYTCAQTYVGGRMRCNIWNVVSTDISELRMWFSFFMSFVSVLLTSSISLIELRFPSKVTLSLAQHRLACACVSQRGLGARCSRIPHAGENAQSRWFVGRVGHKPANRKPPSRLLLGARAHKLGDKQLRNKYPQSRRHDFDAPKAPRTDGVFATSPQEERDHQPDR